MRFDWYQATIKGRTEEAIDALLGLGDEVRSIPGLARMYHYEVGVEVCREGLPVVKGFWGGQNDTVHAVASGEETQVLEGLLRRDFPGHLVTRVDSAEDFDDVTAYERIKAIMMPIAQKKRLEFKEYADKLWPDSGNTQYMGGSGSAARVRLYEKGKEQLSKARKVCRGLLGDASKVWVLNSVTGEKVRADSWARLEVQCRPPEERARVQLSTATPEQVWGCTPAVASLYQEVCGVDVPRFAMTRRRETEEERSLRVMVTQYEKRLQGLFDKCGEDDSAVGRYLREVLEQVRRDRRLGLI